MSKFRPKNLLVEHSIAWLFLSTLRVAGAKESVARAFELLRKWIDAAGAAEEAGDRLVIAIFDESNDYMSAMAKAEEDIEQELQLHMSLLRDHTSKPFKLALIQDIEAILPSGKACPEAAKLLVSVFEDHLQVNHGRHAGESSVPVRSIPQRGWSNEQLARQGVKAEGRVDTEVEGEQGESDGEAGYAGPGSESSGASESSTKAVGNEPMPLLYTHAVGVLCRYMLEISDDFQSMEEESRIVVPLLRQWNELVGLEKGDALAKAALQSVDVLAWMGLIGSSPKSVVAFCIAMVAIGLGNDAKIVCMKTLDIVAKHKKEWEPKTVPILRRIALELKIRPRAENAGALDIGLRSLEIPRSVIEDARAAVDEVQQRLCDGMESPHQAPPQNSESDLHTSFVTASSDPGPVRLHAQARPRFNYAMHGAGIPLIGAIRIENCGSEPLRDCVLSVKVHCGASSEDLATQALQLAEVPGSESLTLRIPELQFDSRILVQLDESIAGEIELEARVDEESLALLRMPIRVLAYNQWTSIEGIEELLACHVVPNHPSIEAIREASSQALRASTGSSSQEGYQSGAERVAQITKATFEALWEQRIRYSNPPAHSEESQKIRTPDQVLGQKFGTCLDTTCLMAACLEQAGLNPVLFLVEGHALVGVWLDDQCAAPNASYRNAEQVLAMIDGKALLPVETTLICNDTKVTFDAAVAEGRKRLGVLKFKCMIDVHRARRSEVRPLPSRIVENGKVTVVHQQWAGPATTVVMGERRVQSAAQKGPAPKRFVAWQRDLLDLSLRNPLLNIKIGRGGGLRVVMPAEAVHDVERALSSEQGLKLVAHDELTELQKARGARVAAQMAADMLRSVFLDHKALFVEAEQAKLRSGLSQLMNRARAMEEQSGTNVLHLSLGSVVWTDPEKGKKVRSPLLVMPVRITLQGRGKPPLMTADATGGGTVVNQCLLQKLAQSFRLEVPKVANWRSDRTDGDIRPVLQEMRQALARENIQGGVEEDAALCLLHFGKFRMWKDLDDHWPQFMQQPVVRHFVEKAGQNFESGFRLPTREELEAEPTFCPIPIDGSQLEAVVAAARGCSFVLEGPPGTGKSQTITNLVANALAAGKKILFVAEKRAALEVVKTRLNKVGLGVYCLDIHGKTSKPQELRSQLLRTLDAQFEADLGAFEKQRRELGDLRSDLASYVDRIHEKNGFGHSLWSARQSVLACGDGPMVPVPDQLFSLGAGAVESVREALRQARWLAASARLEPRHPWGFVDAVAMSADAPARLEKAVVALKASHASPCASLDGASTVAGLRAVAAIVRAKAAGGAIRPESVHAAWSDQAILQQIDACVAALRKSVAEAGPTFRPSLFADDVKALADDLEKATKSFFLFRGGRVRKARVAIDAHLASPVADSKALLAALRRAERIDAETDALTARLQKIPGLALPSGFRPCDDAGANVVSDLVTALRCGVLAAGGRDDVLVNKAMTAAVTSAEAGQARARADAWEAMWLAVEARPELVDAWLTGRTMAEAAADSLSLWTRDADKARFLDLSRWHKLQQKLAEIEAAGFVELRRAIHDGSMDPVTAAAAFERSLAQASLDERMRSLDFERFDGKEHNDCIGRFSEQSDKEAKDLASVLPVKLQATRPFRPGQRIGRVGDLVRNELNRTKGGRSIRQLMEDYANAIIELTPCVLASPDSVAQFLVPGVIEFDIVVFDEASQVPVADAIGAIGRGKSIVVVGDSRQMPPTAFFSRGASSGDDEGGKPGTEVEDEVEDLESILSESVASGLDRIWLSWHYRSQDESLIAFSNRHYYESRLASFPSPARKMSGKGLSWIKVEGATFDSGETRTNIKEAEAVVREVRRRLADPVESKRTMGIVTMNLTQAELVHELLESKADEDPALLRALEDESDERMFIKNLENVQGDERDVILISMTYARSQDGKFAMNFGPLGKVGGERRWNVLVTRAKQQVVVVSSMEPEDIKVERISALAKGVHHMRAYMDMCKRGVERAADVQARPVEQKDLHRERIADALRARGLVVESNVGLSSFKIDLSVSHASQPERRLVAILLDGPGYAERRTVQDRDALPASVLQKMMAWPKVFRIWLPEWLLEEARVVDEVCAAVEEVSQVQRQAALLQTAQRAKPQVQAPASPNSSDHVERPVQDLLDECVASRMSRAEADAYLRAFDEARAEQVRRKAQKSEVASSPSVAATATRDAEDCDYVPYLDDSLVGTKDQLGHDDSSQKHMLIRSVIDHVLRVESPIESTRLAKLVARRFGLQRVREDRVQSVLRHVEGARRFDGEHGSFVWLSAEQQKTWRTFRRTPESLDEPRPFNEIAPEEVRNALVYCATKGMGLSDEGALEEIAEIFGVRRITQDLRARMVAITEWAIRSGALQRDAKGRIVASETR